MIITKLNGGLGNQMFEYAQARSLQIDNDDDLYRLGYFIGGLSNLKALDALPYHTMGKVKYEKLGKEYPLGDTPAMDKGILLEKKAKIIEGIKARRAEK